MKALITLALSMSLTANAEIYQCKEKSGKATFQDFPCGSKRQAASEPSNAPGYLSLGSTEKEIRQYIEKEKLHCEFAKNAHKFSKTEAQRVSASYEIEQYCRK